MGTGNALLWRIKRSACIWMRTQIYPWQYSILMTINVLLLFSLRQFERNGWPFRLKWMRNISISRRFRGHPIKSYYIRNVTWNGTMRVFVHHSVAHIMYTRQCMAKWLTKGSCIGVVAITNRLKWWCWTVSIEFIQCGICLKILGEAHILLRLLSRSLARSSPLPLSLLLSPLYDLCPLVSFIFEWACVLFHLCTLPHNILIYIQLNHFQDRFLKVTEHSVYSNKHKEKKKNSAVTKYDPLNVDDFNLQQDPEQEPNVAKLIARKQSYCKWYILP